MTQIVSAVATGAIITAGVVVIVTTGNPILLQQSIQK
jgi:hypothetical protein